MADVERACVCIAYLAFSDIALVVAGYLLVWSADLRLGEKVGIGFLAALGLT